MRAAACALLGLLAACSLPSRQASLDAGGPSGADAGRDSLLARPRARFDELGSPADARAGDAAAVVGTRAHADPAAASAGQPALGAATALPSSAGTQHQLRVSELVGRARCDAAPLTLDTRFADGALLSLERGARVTLALDDYVRLVLFGPLLARVLPSGQPALLLREGALSLDVAPRGVHGTHSAFWLATPRSRVDVADSARLVVRASTDIGSRAQARASTGAGELVVVSGHAQLAQPDAALPLRAGTAHCVGPRGLTVLSRPFATLEQAVETFASGPSCAGRAGAEPGQGERALESALDAVQQREQRELSLLAEHAHLVAVEDPRAMAVRSLLAGSAGVLLHERAWATALRAQLEALLLGQRPTARQATLLERANALAPYRD